MHYSFMFAFTGVINERTEIHLIRSFFSHPCVYKTENLNITQNDN